MGKTPAIAHMIPPRRRGAAYGIFNTAYSVFWFLGSAVMGVLYDISIAYVIFFSVTLEVLSIPLLLIVRRELSAN